jgi:prolyl-tRNA editing enzyme YbaK/EbsC (Cys-tRNA(Pro) deacylase)
MMQQRKRPDLSNPPLTPTDLDSFMKANAINGEILHLEVPTPTVETAAQAVGVLPDQIVKSVLFLINGNPVLAVACGTAYIDQRAIARHLEVSRKRVKLADADTVMKITGYPAGAVPPFGHPQPLLTLIEPKVLAQAEVWAGGGSGSALVRLNPADILSVTNGEQVSLLKV